MNNTISPLLRYGLYTALLGLSACAGVSSNGLQWQFTPLEDGEMDIVTCLQSDGDIVKERNDNRGLCRLPDGSVAKLRDL